VGLFFFLITFTQDMLAANKEFHSSC